MDSKEQYTCSALNFLTEEMGIKTIYINVVHQQSKITTESSSLSSQKTE